EWCHAREYVEVMWAMLQQDTPDDYVVATGRAHSVQDFLELAFDYVGLDYRKYLVIDSQLYRPAEVDLLIGNPAKAKKRLGWQAKTDFEALVLEMVEADCQALGVNIERRAVSHA